MLLTITETSICSFVFTYVYKVPVYFLAEQLVFKIACERLYREVSFNCIFM